MNYIERLKKVMKDKDYDQGYLIDITGLKQPQISNYMNGVRDINDKNLMKIISSFNHDEVLYIVKDITNSVISKQLTNTMIGRYKRNIQDSHVVNDGGGEEILKIKLDAALEIIKEKEEQIKILKTMLKI